ncbi:MAG: leucyl aminopeptidase [Gemmatales bacterium]|nr:leucyl aminopeptidase [Gemmatales bacterium]MDW8222897.1 leucyl aminopeptidase [Gemmatales bacterium]
MKWNCITSSLRNVEADWLIVPVSEDAITGPAQELDQITGGSVSRLRESGDLRGKLAELLPLVTGPYASAKRLLLVGLGKADDLDRRALYRAGFAAGKYVAARKHARVAVAVPEPTPRLSWRDVILGLGTGVYAAYRGPGIRQNQPDRHAPDETVLVVSSSVPNDEALVAARRAEVEGRAIHLVRDLVNEPPCDLYPESFAHRAELVSQSVGVECTVWDEKRLLAERMGCLLGVAQGSARPPRVVILRYRNGDDKPTLALLGKGVTFDSGGLSLKTTEQMQDMKCDMAGAAAVLGGVQAIAELRLPVNVLGLLALVENMPSGQALKLGDVLRARNGKTVEILNTDAEGRLILADVLCYAIEQNAAHLLDLATLTGACMVALGTEVAGLMSNNDAWAERVRQAATNAGEQVWPLPMFREYGDLLRSHVADVKNVGGRYAGAITAAKFLEHFVADRPWVHLDIAGPAWSSEDGPVRDAGGTGFGVRTIVELAHRYAQEM